MNKFLEKLQKQAEENPMLALGVAAAVVTSLSKLIDSSAGAKSKAAYAKRQNHSIKQSRR